MTDNQKFNFYLPAWNAAKNAQNWRMAKCRLVATVPAENPQFPELAMIWAAASQIAAMEYRAIKPDDFRHGCHVVALGKDKSSAKLNNTECNKVVALFDLLVDSDDLAARVKYDHPEISYRAGLIQALQRLAPDEYIEAICLHVNDTRAWRSLDDTRLLNLLRTVTTRWRDRQAQPGPYDVVDNVEPRMSEEAIAIAMEDQFNPELAPF